MTRFTRAAPHRSNPGKGWVSVRARSLNANEIIHNLEEGLFYASTGVELDDVLITKRTMTIIITKNSDRKFRTDFIGDGGKILLHTEENPAVYCLRDAVHCVHAKIYDSVGFVAWVQPVFVR